jgi:hypothetical protein
MPRSSRFAAMAIALTTLTSPAYAGGAEEIMRLCSQPDNQLSGGQVAFCHAFWEGAADAFKQPATPATAATPLTAAHSVPTPSIAAPSAPLRPGEVPLDQGPAREIPIDQGPAREAPLR